MTACRQLGPKNNLTYCPTWVDHYTGELFVQDMTFSPTQLLFESARISGWANFSIMSYTPTGPCRVGQYVKDALPAITYTPAPEILNAAYPVRLEQLP
jgi:hypothetical protein